MTLFQPFTLKDVMFRNRLAVSPMCQYSANDGFINDYHLIHLGRFALGGFGLVFLEATAVLPEGRITHGCLGLWSDDQISGMARIADALKANGAVAGIQIGHAGPKACTQRPWLGNGPLNDEDSERGELPWTVVSATDQPFDEGWLKPQALSIEAIQSHKKAFVDAALRADKSGFDVLEVHCAHGYLMNSFLSPLTNTRSDQYGGSLENRMRFPLEVVKAVREVWPEGKPLFVRISAVDGVEGGVEIADSVAFAKELKAMGVDIVDCSSGGVVPRYELPSTLGHQVPYAAQIRKEVGVGTMAVGLITDPAQAEDIVATQSADFVAIGREALANPQWALFAEAQLNKSEETFASWSLQSGWWLEHRARHLRDLT
ncbi:NADH:flavin oxidoreductase/NADH oxidase [Teredinibacter haidensis]|uniref:NADH:flavin oxidoreductase/NADH oxidase n=1 Tax=Teredinibacter haidensis TaxID=2731755 RepID=UPI000948A0B0|nr:NADH:flavin oxidoreductase/NADH oxidase [Teredinibacter haidensis]